MARPIQGIETWRACIPALHAQQADRAALCSEKWRDYDHSGRRGFQAGRNRSSCPQAVWPVQSIYSQQAEDLRRWDGPVDQVKKVPLHRLQYKWGPLEWGKAVALATRLEERISGEGWWGVKVRARDEWSQSQLIRSLSVRLQI